MEDASTKEFEACSAVHGPLQHLDTANLSLDGTGGPGQVERGLYGSDVLAQLGGKARERRGARGGQHILELLAALPSQKEGQPLCGRDRPGERGGTSSSSRATNARSASASVSAPAISRRATRRPDGHRHGCPLSAADIGPTSGSALRRRAAQALTVV